jgi:hypothetical protein
MEEQRQTKPMMFLGQYRTGLTRENAALHVRVVRTLLRSGRQGEGMLANRLRENLGSDSWNECVRLLAQWHLIEFEPARTGRARIVALTEHAKQCCIEFGEDGICELPSGEEAFAK